MRPSQVLARPSEWPESFADPNPVGFFSSRSGHMSLPSGTSCYVNLMQLSGERFAKNVNLGQDPQVRFGFAEILR
ncbi:protein of unknown function (plasmid) [Paraburkholderia dioscoreae]|uniref:Uncharacterized protein n=1 Tax=Paraburkholderia dioscoreae TaxID=2604047 RepID=A0A5Q4Z9P2_9BURK|nr:protein of unknown function [Paraburkholderia dioscoreae]